MVEIGERQRKIGEVLKVKPLGALAMIDEGELDWKIVAISLDDPKAPFVNDVDDVEKHFPVSSITLLVITCFSFSWAIYVEAAFTKMLIVLDTQLVSWSATFVCYIIFGCLQGTLTAIRDWFRDYKIPDGKPANKFGLGNKAANKVFLLHEYLESSIIRNSLLSLCTSWQSLAVYIF